MNVVSLTGNLCKDTNDIKYTQGDKSTAILRNTIAVQREFKNKDTNKYDCDFINVVFFGRSAEFVNKYFKKGSRIGVVGRIQTGSYTNKDGQKVYTTDVIVEKVEFESSKSEGGNNNSRPDANDFVNEGIDLDPNDLPFK